MWKPASTRVGLAARGLRKLFRMTHTKFVGVAIAAVALAGCPDMEGSGGSNPALLTGTWEVNVTDPEDADIVTFNSDGTYVLENDGEITQGTFRADASTLTLTESNGDIGEYPYVVDGDQLLLIGLRRVLTGTDFVGDWHADGFEDNLEQSIDLSIRADTTMRFAFNGTEGSLVFEGTWREDAGELVTEFLFDGLPVELEWASVRGAIGFPLYERH